MKEELFSLFRAFRRFALDISAEKTNVVVGFSWRTGIFLGNDNPAYGLWNDLSDHRTERKLKIFDLKDSNKMISSFEVEAGINLTKPLKARLIQQAQGFPWFLKKLCIHLFKKIKEGISQEELLISQMQIKNLFDEDLDRPSGEVECLRFVAKKSPVLRNEATREFGEYTVSRLISDRLLIKTGEKISVYWDVFRDYLITNETPVISWAFMPNYKANLSLKFVELIKDKATSIDELVEITNYSRGTIQNIFIDLLSFALVVKTEDDKYKINCEIDEIPLKVRNQMLGHVIYQEALSACKNNEESIITVEDMSLIINKAYASDEGKTLGRYVAKILSWLRFAGLMSHLQDKVRVYDTESYSPDFGEITGGTRKTSLFLAASSFEKAAVLLEKLTSPKPIEQAGSGVRNVVADLVALGICRRVSNNRIELFKPNNPELSIEQQLAYKVLEADTIILLDKLISIYGEELNILVEKMSIELGKKWKQTSGQRYINALIRYRNFALKTLNY